MKRVLLAASAACVAVVVSGCCCCGHFFDCCGGAGCGPMYWGDWCTGNPHCSTCDDCANWIGPPAPGGNGTPPEIYGRQGPYGQQVARHAPAPRMMGPSMGPQMGPAMGPQMARRSMPAQRMAPQMARRSVPPQMAPPSSRRTSPAPGPAQHASRGGRQEYEGAIEVLGVTDRVVKPAALPSAAPQMASRQAEPTLADPPSRVTTTSHRATRR